MRSARTRWDAFWYEQSSPVGLATCRVLFFSALLVYSLRIDYKELAGLPPHFWQPVWPFTALSLGLPSAAVLDLLQWLWRASLLAACVGLASRWSTAAAFGLGVYLVGLPQNVARINHSEAILVFGLAVMALSHCADALSVDAWSGRGRERSRHRTSLSGEYTWPVRAMWLVVVSIYFAAGVTKLRASGLAWVTSDSLSNLLVFGPITASPLTLIGQEIGRHQTLSSIMAGMALALELSMPLVLVNRTARRILVPCVFAMQLTIRILMGPGFTEFLICGLFWIPWDLVAEHIALRRESRRSWLPIHGSPAT